MSARVDQIFAAIRSLSFAQRAIADDWVKRSGLSRQQGFTLRFIEVHQDRGVIARELAEMSGTTAASVTSLLKGLEERGLVTRTPSPEDSRVKLLHITAEGSSLIAGFDQEMTSGQEALFAGLDPQEMDQLATLLDKAVTALPPEHHPHRGERPGPGTLAG